MICGRAHVSYQRRSERGQRALDLVLLEERRRQPVVRLRVAAVRGDRLLKVGCRQLEVLRLWLLALQALFRPGTIRERMCQAFEDTQAWPA